MKLVSEFLGGLNDISIAEISGLLSCYGGEIEEVTERLLFFSTPKPERLISRVAYSKRIGRVIEGEDPIDIAPGKTFAIKEKREEGRKSLIDSIAKTVMGKVDLGRPDVVLYVYNSETPVISEVMFERRMSDLIDPRYKKKPFNHPSSISPVLARGMLNIAGLEEGDKFVDPFAGTGTYLIEGYRMGIEGYGIDRSWRMVEGGNQNLKHFGFPETIRQGDFSELLNLDGISAIVGDPPYGRGAKIFSQSRDSLYSRFFSLISGVRGNKVFCLPALELVSSAGEYLDIELVGSLRVHSSLTRYVVISH